MMNRKLVAALVAFGLALPAVTRAQDAPVEEQIVNQMNKVFGVHAGFRANHAKGVVAEGKFKASPEAAGLSKAVLFGGTDVPVTVRFSDFYGGAEFARRLRRRQSAWHGGKVSPARRQRHGHCN